MKPFFTLSIILLALLCGAAPMADAKVKKAKGKAKSTATTTKWTEVANSSTSAYYISPKEYNLKIDNEGYYYLTVKLVPFKHSLESQRQEFAERFKNPKLTKYTHSLNLYKIDVDNMRWVPLKITFYANNQILDTVNIEGMFDWFAPPYNSPGYEIIKLVRQAVKGY